MWWHGFVGFIALVDANVDGDGRCVATVVVEGGKCGDGDNIYRSELRVCLMLSLRLFVFVFTTGSFVVAACIIVTIGVVVVLCGSVSALSVAVLMPL